MDGEAHVCIYYVGSMIIDRTGCAYALMDMHTYAIYIRFNIYSTPSYIHAICTMNHALFFQLQLRFLQKAMLHKFGKIFFALPMAWQSHLILLTDFIDRFLP